MWTSGTSIFNFFVSYDAVLRSCQVVRSVCLAVATPFVIFSPVVCESALLVVKQAMLDSSAWPTFRNVLVGESAF